MNPPPCLWHEVERPKAHSCAAAAALCCCSLDSSFLRARTHPGPGAPGRFRALPGFSAWLFRSPEGSKTGQESSKRPPRRSKKAPRRPNIAPRCPRRLQDSTRGPQDVSKSTPKKASRGQKSSNSYGKTCIFSIYDLSALTALKTAQEAPTTAPGQPKRPPRQPRRAPRRPRDAQDGPKRGPRRPKRAPRRAQEGARRGGKTLISRPRPPDAPKRP